MSKLSDILQEEVLSEINQILAEADSKAEMLIAEAKSKASERVETYRKKAEAELRAATARAKSAADLFVSIARIRTKGQEITLVRQKAEAAIEEIANKPNYGEILEALAEEALRAVEKADAAAVHPDDMDKLSAWAKQKGLELTTDRRLHFGVRIMATGGRYSVENTLPERLQRGWEALVSGVEQRLWGEPYSPSISEK